MALQVEWEPDRPAGSAGDAGRDDFFRRHRLRTVRRQPVHRSRMIGMPQATEYLPRAYFPTISDMDAYTVCVQHLEKVRMAADESWQKYG